MMKKLLALTTLILLLAGMSGSVAGAQLQTPPIVVTTLCTALATGTCGTIHGPLAGRNVSVYVETSAGVTAGTVVIEEASADTFGGTWSQVQSISTTVASQSTAVHVSNSMFGALRVRISSPIVGGTVNVTSLVGQ